MDFFIFQDITKNILHLKVTLIILNLFFSLTADEDEQKMAVVENVLGERVWVSVGELTAWVLKCF